MNKALTFYCKSSPSSRVLTSVRNGALLGAAKGAYFGFVSGEIFGGEVTFGLSGVGGAGLGAVIQGTIGATTGVITGSLPLRLAKQLALTLLAANVEWKMSYFQKSSKKTFLQRLGSVALFWGLPALCLELIGIPRQGLGSVLLIAVPVTILGVFVFALIELGVVRYIQRNFMDGKAKLGA